jgi:hypothetical protein
MERAEAEAVYEGGRERCVELILGLATRNERLEERLGRLEEQVRKSSRNSSTPPSEDPPKTRAERRAEARAKAKAWAKREGEKRKQGGQPGHEGSGRKLLPEDQINEFRHYYPDCCGGCGREFTEDEKTPAGRFGRHQVADLPLVAIVYIEHRTHHLPCPSCGKQTAGKLPAEVQGSPFGVGVQAAVVTLTARNRVSRRDMPELARELFGLGISAGAVDAICQRASAALGDPHRQLTEKVLSSPALNVDETGWYTEHDPRTMWTATTPWAAIFRICEDRHRDRLAELIGTDFKGHPLLGSLVGLRAHRPRVTSGVLGASEARLVPTLRGASRAEGVRHRRPCADQAAVQDLARLRGTPGPRTADRRDSSDPGEAADTRPERRTQEHAHPLPPQVREEPPEDLARALHVRHRRGRPADK